MKPSFLFRTRTKLAKTQRDTRNSVDESINRKLERRNLIRTFFLQFLAVPPLFFTTGLQAAPPLLFTDNFDGDSYTDNAPLATGANNLENGVWGVNHEASGTAIVSTETALSAPRSLALSVGAEGGRAQVVGSFSEDGAAPQAVTGGYSLRFSFMMKDSTFDSWFYISGDGGQCVTIAVGETVCAYYRDSHSEVSSGLSADTWYTLEVNVPPIASGSGTYTVNLYDSKNERMGFSSGILRGDAEVLNYNFFTIYNNTLDSILYIDNITAAPTEETPR